MYCTIAAIFFSREAESRTEKHIAVTFFLKEERKGGRGVRNCYLLLRFSPRELVSQGKKRKEENRYIASLLFSTE